MKQGSTMFLRFVMCMLCVAVLALCAIPLPWALQGGESDVLLVRISVSLIAAGMYTTAVPFFIAVWHGFKLLRQIDQNAVFTDASVRLLGTIKRCVTMMAVLYVGGIPLLYPLAESEDAPGLILFGTLFALIIASVAVSVTILHGALQRAVAMKSEQDLTV